VDVDQTLFVVGRGAIGLVGCSGRELNEIGRWELGEFG